MKVTNTTKKIHDDPSTALLEATVLGANGFIEGMEAQGQRELVASTVLPVDGSNDPRLTELGFILGEPVSGDSLFREATLPAGWKRVGSDHAMWSHIQDERGLERVAVFYKAAFYDRNAHMTVVNVGAGLASKAIYGDSEVPWELLTADEREAAVEALNHYLSQAERHPDIYGEQVPRTHALLAEAATL